MLIVKNHVLPKLYTEDVFRMTVRGTDLVTGIALDPDVITATVVGSKLKGTVELNSSGCGCSDIVQQMDGPAEWRR